jgi:uncharacterized repeat protein (TIGR03803 family)
MKILYILTKLILVFALVINIARAQVTVTIPCDRDNSIYSTVPENSNGAGAILLIGRQGEDAGLTIGRSLFHFDLSSIPAGSIIKSATLTLRVYRSRSGSVSLHRLKTNWGEGSSIGGRQGATATEGDATWNHNFFSNKEWNTAGGDFESTASASTDFFGGDSLILPNLTGDVQLWLGNSSVNFGWILKGTDESIAHTAKLILSRHNVDSTLRPVLSVTYCNGSTVYADTDADGFGDIFNKLFVSDCIAPAGYVYDSTDCNDKNASVHPGACDARNGNGIDDNCDGVIDDGFGATSYYIDADGDGYGAGSEISLCNNPGAGYSTNNTDCNDHNPAIHPKACDLRNGNGIDDNCDAVADNGFGEPKLYGLTAQGGGINQTGVIFSFDPSSSTYTQLTVFDTTDAVSPIGGIIQANDGKLYGLTNAGGAYARGIIFSFDPVASVYTKVKDLEQNVYDTRPTGSLMQASDGKLYGMLFGMTYDKERGAMFSFDPITSAYIKIRDFNVSKNGLNPTGILVQARDGKLYGLTFRGGSGNKGVIFSYDPSASSFTKLKDFDGNSGAEPSGNSLIQAQDGKLYGMTSGGGSRKAGVIFSFDPTSSTFTKLMDFNGSDGGYPYTNTLMQASDGKLYGITSAGGSSNNGVIFSFDPSSATYTKLKDFNGADGSYPSGRLMQRSDGKLYGMTFGGGNNGAGVIFSFDPSSSTYTRLKDFDGTDGSYPNYAALIDVSECIDENKTLTAKITSPVEGSRYTANATIILSADVKNEDGKVKTVSFYNGDKLIFTELAPPFYRKWFNVKEGTYTITAKATDNSGNVTTSAPIHFTVLPSTSPSVIIKSPLNESTFTAGSAILLNADAFAPGIGVHKVEFFHDNNLILTQYQRPYAAHWFKVPVGNYSITAKATDNNGNVITSLPVQITVTGVLSRPMVIEEGSSLKEKSLSLRLNPNPVRNTLNIAVEGLTAGTNSSVFLVSASGVVVKTIQAKTLNRNTKLDVSSLSAGVYSLKVINGDKIVYKQFVKL